MSRTFKFKIDDEVSLKECLCSNDKVINENKGKVLVVSKLNDAQSGLAKNYALKTKSGELIMREDIPGRTHPFFCDELELY